MSRMGEAQTMAKQNQKSRLITASGRSIRVATLLFSLTVALVVVVVVVVPSSVSAEVTNGTGQRRIPASMATAAFPSEETIAIWERQYSPSQWSVRFPTPEAVIDDHVSHVTAVSEANRKELVTRLDVPYGGDEREKIDIYGDDLPGDAPLFVYIHGGYWQMLSKEISAYGAKPLVERGVRVMIVGYELCPTVTLEELVKQIKVAGEFVLNYAEENGVSHVSFAGHSAGAHLIASMFDREFVNAVGDDEMKLVKHLFLISGVYNVQELRYTESVNDKNLLGITDGNAVPLSPLYGDFGHLRSYPGLKFHVYVAEHDSDVFRQMAARMHEYLTIFGLGSQLHQLPALDHFDIVGNLDSVEHPLTNAIINSFDENK